MRKIDRLRKRMARRARENPYVDPELIYEELEAGASAPFKRMLTKVIAAEPSLEAIQAYAYKFPDKWANMVSILRKASGYTDKSELEVNMAVVVGKMSDLELIERLKELEEADELELQPDGTYLPKPN